MSAVGRRSAFALLFILLFLDTSFAQRHEQLRNLSSSDAWLALLHSHKSGEVFKSEIDAKDFFLSPQGKEDPHAELLASIDLLFPLKGKGSRICDYPARYEFLKDAFFAQGPRPEDLCPKLRAFRESRDTQSVSLIFAESFLGNPASMFGHTFLRFERKGLRRSRLLDDTVAFAADSQGEGGLPLVWKGLTGGYRAGFLEAPYHLRVRQYGDIDRRDLWEYPLNLSREQLRFLDLHLWELKKASFDYYFLDENCSYHLLSLLRVLYPQLDILRQRAAYVIPVDTLRVLEQAGILSGKAKKRLSLSSELTGYSKELSRAEASLVKGITKRGFAPELEARLSQQDEQRKALLLDASDALLRFVDVDQNEDSSQKRAEIAKRRSKLAIASEVSLPSASTADPLQGHRPGRLQFAFGLEDFQSDARSYLQTDIRPALHSLMDPSPGYMPHAELYFLQPAFRLYDDTGNLSLESMDVLQLRTLPPMHALYRPYSWQIGLKLERFRMADDDRDLVLSPSGSIGGSVLLGKRIRASLLATGEALLSRHFQDSAELLPGLLAQVQWQPHERWQWQISAEGSRAVLDEHVWLYSLSLKQSFRIKKNLAQSFELKKSREFSSESSMDLLLGVKWYFSIFP